MEQVILDKITRFVELSKKFTKTAEEVLNRADLNQVIGWASVQGQYNTISVENIKEYTYLSGKIKSDKSLSKAEVILKEAEIQAQLANEYDEYIELQKDLSEYFQAVNKLNN